MRISAITNWAYGITVFLTVVSGAAFIFSSHSADLERLTVQEHLALDDLGEELALGAEETTDEARLYVMRGEDRHLQAFQGKEGEERRRETAIGNIRALGGSAAELAALDEIESDADVLDKVEEGAVAAYRSGDRLGAQQTLFGPEHDRLQTAVLDTVRRFRELTATRTESAMDQAKARSDFWGAIAKTMLGLTAAVFLAVLYFILRRRVALPLMRMTGIVNRLAKQDYEVEVPLDSRRDEIGEMNEAIHIFRENGIERERLDAERRRDQQTKDLILQMMHRLQACAAQYELAEVVALFAPQIFPNFAGNLYVMNESRTMLTRVSTWLDPVRPERVFPANACWGLRRGRPHVSDASHNDIPCQHLDDQEVAGLCVPLTAQGDAIGLLYLEERPQSQAASETSRLYLELIAENIGLAVANLQLRDKLTNLAVRDALTGLFNRRSLDEALNRYARDEAHQPIVCMMIDIDHFKRFNDEHGHDAGDEVMRYVAQILVDTVSTAGTAYRFGGEEFTVLLHEATEEEGFQLAEQIRSRVLATPLAHRGRVLGAVSISVGVASSPLAGSIATLLSRADAALLEAKAAGRNRTVSASITFGEQAIKRSS
ncbi:MAG: diguanylate cyclase [Rhizobiaceae bacterium]|nr:diguanylate cyclase [Rhizobiaceae bacterium]